MIDLTCPQTPDEIGPPEGVPDALESWRRVIAALERLQAGIDRFDGALAQTQIDLGGEAHLAQALDRESALQDG